MGVLTEDGIIGFNSFPNTRVYVFFVRFCIFITGTIFVLAKKSRKLEKNATAMMSKKIKIK